MSKSNPVTPQMNSEQLREFLAKPHLMDIATITPDGYPHVTPVWFKYDGVLLWVSTTKERKKARNLMTNSKVGFSIAEHSLPYRAVVGYGEVEVIDNNNGSLLKELAYRYLPKEKAGKYFEELMREMGDGDTRVILKIKPKWILSWTGE